MVALTDSSCTAATALLISNEDREGVPVPEAPVDDDCVARLGIYQRDIKAETTVPDSVIWNARIGLEVHPPCPNPACQYWYQLFDSSDAALFEHYDDEALKAHYPIALGYGESQTPFVDRIERYQIQASAISRPATTHKHLRIKATPVFQKVPLSLDADAVKIRDDTARSLFIFSRGDAKTYRWTAPAAGTYGPGTVAPIVNLSAIGMDASDATDACLISDKLYVIAPGELFVVDLNSGEEVLNSGVRGETRTATFIEAVGGKPFAIYQSDSETIKVKCYDLSFPTPKKVWELNELVTATQIADGKLLLAAGSKLYSSTGGNAAPTLIHTFPAAITALATDYVGLENDSIWRKKSATVWQQVETLHGPVGAIWPWYGGAAEMRALAGATSGDHANTLRTEQTTLNWTTDIALEGATGVKSMRALAIETSPMTANAPALFDEWMLIGDDNRKLWVYSRTPLSEKDGAIKACHVAVPRLFPLLRRADPVS